MRVEKESPDGRYGEKLKKRNDATHRFTEGKGSFQPNEKKWLFDGVEEAEQRTLGLILWEPDRINQAVKTLIPSDFRYHKHKVIFGAMLDMRKRDIPIDVYSVGCFLEECGELDRVGGSMYLTYLPQITFWGEVEL